ncbi:DUF1634 domain-containing protein [Lactobacillus sp. AN1001]
MSKNNSTRKEMLEVEIVIGKIMRIGVLFSAAVMILGFAMFLITGNSGYPATSFPTTLPAIWQGLISFKPYAYMMAGIYLLILTPVLRVVISIYAFYQEKDMLYVKITSLVLLILIISVIVGHH